MRFAFTPPRPRRRPSLTPMIDVVFRLLIFFMLAARFGQEAQLTLSPAGTGGGAWSGPPRLIEVDADAIRLNGRHVSVDALLSALPDLMSDPADPILILPDPTADTQRLLDVLAPLTQAGFTGAALVAP